MMQCEVKIDEEKLTDRSVGEIHADLTAALKNADLWDSLDYFEISIAMKKKEKLSFPNFEWLSCCPVTGEGGDHYIYIGTITNGRYRLIFVGKTSQGFHAACKVANMSAVQLGA